MQKQIDNLLREASRKELGNMQFIINTQPESTRVTDYGLEVLYLRAEDPYQMLSEATQAGYNIGIDDCETHSMKLSMNHGEVESGTLFGEDLSDLELKLCNILF